MLSMDNGVVEQIVTPQEVVEEDGEILEDGEIDEEDAVQQIEAEDDDEVKEDDEVSDEKDADEKKKHHRKSHHKRRKRKHDKEDRKSEEKKSRHKKRKGEEGSEEGGESPPTKKKKKRKKHTKDKKERESASPEVVAYEQTDSLHRGSVSPPLPSEQGYYDAYETVGKYKSYSDYNQSTTDYNQSATEYDSKLSRSAYNYNNPDSYQQDDEFSSGSDSYYSDFESHLAQYQNYKKNSLTDKPTNNEETNYDDDNYYSVGYDDNVKRQRRTRESSSRSHRSQRHRNGGSNSYDDKRRNGRSRQKQATASPDNNGEIPVCRYFREGHCGKGDKCTYSHRISPRRNRESRSKKHPELCQFYMTGSCSNGDKCNYMHEDYPCKYFHTGTKCLAGEKCLFSHEALNEQTKPIVQKWQDMYNSIDDSEEIEALEKAGLRPLQKPPPGMGLLPTPSIKPPQATAVKPAAPLLGGHTPRMTGIPSLFDIQVEPSPELQKRIDQNAVPSLTMTDDELIAHQASLARQNQLFSHNQGGLLPLPTPKVPQITPYYPPGAGILGAAPAGMHPHSGAQMQAQSQLPVEEQENVGDEFYESLDQNNDGGLMQATNMQEKDNQLDSKKDIHDHVNDYHMKTHHDDDTVEDVIRMDDHDVIKDDVKAPAFLPAKQKALFMRIHQKRKSSNDSQSTEDVARDESGKENATDSWTYSSEEDESSAGSRRSRSSGNRRQPAVSTATNSVQSIMQMISSKKSKEVDTNLLSKVASVISMSPAAKPSPSPSHGQDGMMSPPQHPPHHRERKLSSGSSSSPGHPSTKLPYHAPQSLRRRLSTSELNKEPIVIPLVAKQSADSMHASHPDPRISLSRLFGQKRTEFRGPRPEFGKDLLPMSGKLVGLKITLSSEGNRPNPTDKRADPRLSMQQTRTKPAVADPRVKSKPNDPRLGRRASATMKSPPSQQSTPAPKPLIPQKPAALLTKPPSSIIPSLPELNLDLAHVAENNKTSPTSTADASGLPKLLRASGKPSALHKPPSTPETTETTSPTPIAPYDPRFITAGSKTTTAVTSAPAPYDPRAMTTTPVITPAPSVSAPPLYDPRHTNPEAKKRTIQLPKLTPAPPRLTPAPGYVAKKLKVGDTNGNSPDLPSGEQQDF